MLILNISIYQNVDSLTTISEVMYNPDGNDNNKEFVEIYSNDYNNLTNFSIEDLSGSKDTLKLTYHYNSNYSLIVEDGFNYTGINASIYTIGNTIGNDLHNDKDIIILRDNTEKILDVLAYYDNFGGDDNGKSLEKISLDDYTNNYANWKESILDGGTPGRENSVLSINFNDLRINELLPNPKGEDDANIPNGEWVEIYNNLDKDIDLQNFVLEDDANHKLIISDTNTLPKTIKKKAYSLIYLNSISGFLNNDGFERVKLLYGNKIIDEITYTNSKEDFSWSKFENIWKLIKPSPGSDNIDEDNSVQGNSFIDIVKVYTGNDNTLSFGNEFETRLNVYKGNTSKNSIDIWVQKDDKKVSKVTNFNIYGKFINYTINIPLILDSNCDSKDKDGTYEIIVKGLDSQDKKDVEIKGYDKKLCNVRIETKENVLEQDFNSNLQGKNEEEIVHSQDKINSETSIIQSKVVYESSDLKAKNLSSYILITTLLLIIIFILFRKGL
ncbi:MAG: lamin tail domain-containing protein [Nanoarchaeota archaeon]